MRIVRPLRALKRLGCDLRPLYTFKDAARLMRRLLKRRPEDYPRWKFVDPPRWWQPTAASRKRQQMTRAIYSYPCVVEHVYPQEHHRAVVDIIEQGSADIIADELGRIVYAGSSETIVPIKARLAAADLIASPSPSRS